MAKKVSSRKAASKSKKAPASEATQEASSRTTTKAAVQSVKKAKAARKTASASKAKTAKKAKKVAKAPAEVRPVKKVKTPLRKAALDKFHTMLLEKRRSLVGDMTGMQAEAFHGGHENGSDLSLMPDHPANIATDNYEQEFTLGLLESERILLAEIDAALGRIERRTYGVCLGTGEFIGTPRLQARPWAKYSIDYARKVEQGLVRPGEDDLIKDNGELED